MNRHETTGHEMKRSYCADRLQLAYVGRTNEMCTIQTTTANRRHGTRTVRIYCAVVRLSAGQLTRLIIKGYSAAKSEQDTI